MRFATYELAGRTYGGVVVGSGVHALADDTTVLDLACEGLPAALEAGARATRNSPEVPLERVRLRPPLQAPTIRDFVAFEEHVEGVRKSVDGVAGVPAEWFEVPTFYFTNPYALIGTGDDIAMPPGCTLLDYELEVAAVVGFEGSNLSPKEAREVVFGYTILNDWSARDLQSREMKVGLGPAKGKDFASTLGPWLVTADEFEGRHDDEGFLPVLMTVDVDGVEIGRDQLSNMGWPFEDLIAYASRGTAVRPGDVLGSGTCGNGGCLAELWGRAGRQEPPPLQPGNVVTMTVEGIGTIRNRVVAGGVAPDIPAARPRPRNRA
jgi:2-keto-4-pentenoate hydratase/2-oxohepta-3-ene-1,7-dioic acid hydratase in catechol pathway